LGEDQSVYEDIEWELLNIGVLQTRLPVRSQLAEDNQKAGQQKERMSYVVKAIPKKSFELMSTYINTIYFSASMKGILDDIFSNHVNINSDSYIIDQDNINTGLYIQVLIPPTSLSKIIDYLDDSFGIYSGALGFFCNFDNTLEVMNLTTRINKDSTFTIYHMSSDSAQNEKLQEKTFDGNHFISYAAIKTDYAGNTKFADVGTNSYFISKPRNNFVIIRDYNLNDICSDYGLIYQSDYMFINDVVEGRKRYYTHVEEDVEAENDISIKAKLARDMSNLTYTSIDLDRNILLTKLFDIGSAVTLDTKTVQYHGVSGKYIFHSSDIFFTRTREWTPVATVNLIRTNKLIS
jgi:hypothetical protein